MRNPLVWPDDDIVSATLEPRGLSTQSQDINPSRASAERRFGPSNVAHVRHRAALACHGCRSLHARCDGKKPTCSRCKEEHRVCGYPKSRRRRSGSAMSMAARPPLPSPPTESFFAYGILTCDRSRTVRKETEDTLKYHDVSLSDAGIDIGDVGTTWEAAPPTPLHSPLEELGLAVHDDNTTTLNFLRQWIKDQGAHRCIELYYLHFHNAHPFAPPKAYITAQIQQPQNALLPAPLYLYAAMSYVGGIYQRLSGGGRGASQPVISLQLLVACLDRHPNPSRWDVHVIYHVAALLLISIAKFGQGEIKESGDCLAKAISVATQMGMNRVELIAMTKRKGQDDQSLVELWIRTYWYLHIMDEALQQHVSAMGESNRDFGYILGPPSPDFPLPSCNNHHDGSNMEITPTLSIFDFADLEDETPEFSSLAYLIDLVRVSRLIKRLFSVKKNRNIPGKGDEVGPFDMCTVMRADALLINWKLRLPAQSQQLPVVVSRTGEIDDIMLQCHLLFNSLRTFVHSSNRSTRGDDHENLSSGSHHDVTNLIHRRARLEASGAGVNLVTIHPRLLISSPLNITSLSQCAMAGIAAQTQTQPTATSSSKAFMQSQDNSYSNPKPRGDRGHYRPSFDDNDNNNDDDDDFSRDNLRLALGALKQASGTWNLAQTESKQLKAIARKYYHSPRPSTLPPSGAQAPPVTTDRSRQVQFIHIPSSSSAGSDPVSSSNCNTTNSTRTMDDFHLTETDYDAITETTSRLLDMAADFFSPSPPFLLDAGAGTGRQLDGSYHDYAASTALLIDPRDGYSGHDDLDDGLRLWG